MAVLFRYIKSFFTLSLPSMIGFIVSHVLLLCDLGTRCIQFITWAFFLPLNSNWYLWYLFWNIVIAVAWFSQKLTFRHDLVLWKRHPFSSDGAPLVHVVSRVTWITLELSLPNFQLPYWSKLWIFLSLRPNKIIYICRVSLKTTFGDHLIFR